MDEYKGVVGRERSLYNAKTAYALLLIESLTDGQQNDSVKSPSSGLVATITSLNSSFGGRTSLAMTEWSTAPGAGIRY